MKNRWNDFDEAGEVTCVTHLHKSSTNQKQNILINEEELMN